MPDDATHTDRFTSGDVRRRDMEAGFSRLKASEDTVSASFSSEDPYDRGHYIEILDHGPEAVNLGRAGDGLPLLLDHDPSKVIGRATDIRIEGRKLRGTLRFGNSQMAKDVKADVLDGIRREVSVGYSVERMQREDSGNDVYRVTRWTPMEFSIVACPADSTVGVGRSHGHPKRNLDMPDNIDHQDRQPAVDGVKAERQRAEEILAIGTRFNCVDAAREHIAAGKTVDQFRTAVLNQQGTRMAYAAKPETDSDGGLFGRDPSFEAHARNYSLLRAINAKLDGRPLDGLEREVSDEIRRRSDNPPTGFFVPTSAIMKRAALTAGGVGTGAELVGTDHLGAEYIEALRSVSKVTRLGARILSGLQGNVSIPKQATTTAATWVAESAAAAESTPTFTSLELIPCRATANVSYSSQLLRQGLPSVEGLMVEDLQKQIGLAIDQAAVKGSGTGNEPLGILNVAGIGAVAIGTNGGAPTWDHIVALESAIAESNADIGQLGYLTNSAVRGKLKATEKSAGTAQFVWGDHPQREPGMGMLNGYLAAVSNNVPGNLTKGTGTNLSVIIFGNWADLMIGEWGGVDIIVNPYTKAKEGDVEITARAFVDIGVRHPESFAAIVDAVTA